MNYIEDYKSNFLENFFGKRIVKTAFATALALFIAKLLDLYSPIMAGISAIIAMKSSIFDSYKESVNRIFATVLGAFVACIFQYFGMTGFFGTFFGIIITINLCILFKWKMAISLSCIVFIVVILHNPTPPLYMSYWVYSLNRIKDTFIGILVGFFVNYIIFPPNRSEFILKTYKKAQSELENALLNILAEKNVKLTSIIEDINDLNHELTFIKKDNKFKKRYNFKIAQIANLNAKFYTSFGIIAQFSESEKIPIITYENKMDLERYFGKAITIKNDISSEVYESAFNYYLDDLINLLFEIDREIDVLDEDLKNNMLQR